MKQTSVPLSQRIIVLEENTTSTGSRKLTYGERIVIGQILDGCKNSDPEDSDTQFKIFKDIMGALHPDNTAPTKENILYTLEILEGIKVWAEREKELLAYTPDSKEKAAGLNKLFESCGQFLVLKALARSHGKSIDEVQKWPYATVFTIQYTDLQETKYKKNLERLHRPKKGKKNGTIKL